jgi:3-dehydroquinate dehydratase/shikimate dehydrogenase
VSATTATVIASVIARDAAHGRRELRSAPAGCALVELRADRLRREAIAEVVRTLDRPAVVAVRRLEEGGFFDGSEQERHLALETALEAGAAFVDVEWGSLPAALARGPAASRVILSCHGARADEAELASLWRELAAWPAGRIKLVPRANGVGAAAAAVRALLARAAPEGPRLACFASGRAGAVTRLLAPSWGSWATYGSLAPGSETAEGQFSAREMLELYEVSSIDRGTHRFAIVGQDVFGSPTPAMYREACRELGVEARCFPIEADAFEDVLPLLGSGGAAGIEALAVTRPFKGDAAARSGAGDDVARRARAVNTVLIGDAGWTGFNTDGPALEALARPWLAPAGARVAIAGAGGTARAAAAVFAAGGSVVTVYNRTRERAEALAADLGVAAADWSALPTAVWDVLVQATPLGADGERWLPPAALGGRLLLEAAYGREPTPLVADARRRGLAVADGVDLLVAQGVLQLERILGRRPRAETLRRAATSWLGARTRCRGPVDGGAGPA